MTLRRALSILFLFSASGTLAQAPDFLEELDPYQPERIVSGTIRVFGNNYIPALMQQWQDGFRMYHPTVRFETNLKGTETALAGLYGNAADLAFVGREPYQPELAAFRERFGYDPLTIEISSGSYNTAHKTFALMVFVHRHNPLTKLSLKQLDALYGCERRRGAVDQIRLWGQLGLTGEWAMKPVHVYGYNYDTGMAAFFRKIVLLDSFKWNSDLTDFDNGRTPGGQVINAGVYVLEALARDPLGIAYANVLFGNPEVKAVALAKNDGGPWILPSLETAWRRQYPLTRFTTVCVNRPPGKPLDPKVKEFLRYLLSRDGMAAVVRDGSYLPLTRHLVLQESHKLQ